MKNYRYSNIISYFFETNWLGRQVLMVEVPNDLVGVIGDNSTRIRHATRFESAQYQVIKGIKND